MLIPGIIDAVQIDAASGGAGTPSFVVRRASGAVVGWANGGGLYDVAGVSAAIDVTAGESWAGFGGGGFFGCALVSGGVVRCWGTNYAGELGDGTTTSSGATSVAVMGVTGAVDIDAGFQIDAGGGGHVCASLLTGAVWCWGAAHRGQLARTATAPAPPAPAGGLAEITSVAGMFHSECALSSTGVVRCWGGNTFQQLGDGTTTDRYTPVVVLGL